MKNIDERLKAGLLFLLLLASGLTSCQPEPQPIQYGFDGCEHCKMTISDARYGTELVTDKGKVYKFDSIECMAAYLNEQEQKDAVAYTLVTDFEEPEKLMAVESAVILQSEGLPSPMGMFLTAFENTETAKQYQQERGGTFLSWEETLNLNKK